MKEEKEESVNLEGALKNLNDKMNEDIENTVNNNTINKPPTQTGGNRMKQNFKSKKENNLTHKIRLLKLKLTKKKLQKQLNDNNLGMHHVKSIHSKKKKLNINIYKKNSSGKRTKHKS